MRFERTTTATIGLLLLSFLQAGLGSRILDARPPREDLAADASLPADTRLWAALQDASGGTWGGCVYDVDAILKVLAAGKRALRDNERQES